VEDISLRRVKVFGGYFDRWNAWTYTEGVNFSMNELLKAFGKITAELIRKSIPISMFVIICTFP